MNVVGYCLIAAFVALMTYVGYIMFRAPAACGRRCGHHHNEKET